MPPKADYWKHLNVVGVVAYSLIAECQQPNVSLSALPKPGEKKRLRKAFTKGGNAVIGALKILALPKRGGGGLTYAKTFWWICRCIPKTLSVLSRVITEPK